ncbi:MAG: TldD/PmbA family protein [Pseudomonadota bacterium]
MAIISEGEARAILERVMKLSQAEECEANLSGGVAGNIRYALNKVTTSGIVDDVQLVVQSSYGKKLGSATINEFDDASLEKAVRRSEELARLAPENPEWVSVEGPSKFEKSDAFVERTANIQPALRAEAAASSINPAVKQKATAAGFLNDTAFFQAMMNHKGLFAYHSATNANFTVTMRTDDGQGSGWATRDANDIAKLDAAGASEVALDKAVRSRGAKALEPGKYTVILEPAASVGLIGNMIGAFDARLADEGRSFLSAGEGKTKIGQKLFDERVNLYSDPSYAGAPGGTWSGDGRPVEPVQWIENGVVKNVVCSRYWAREHDYPSIPNPTNGIMTGGDKSLAEMIEDTERGVLVTRTWYIRSVDPQSQLYTGLTRDGTFYIENGKIRYPVKNFRFNESPVIMLNNLEELGRPERVTIGGGNIFGGFGISTTPVMMPPMKIREFTFSSLSDAV